MIMKLKCASITVIRLNTFENLGFSDLSKARHRNVVAENVINSGPSAFQAPALHLLDHVVSFINNKIFSKFQWHLYKTTEDN